MHFFFLNHPFQAFLVSKTNIHFKKTHTIEIQLTAQGRGEGSRPQQTRPNASFFLTCSLIQILNVLFLWAVSAWRWYWSWWWRWWTFYNFFIYILSGVQVQGLFFMNIPGSNCNIPETNILLNNIIEHYLCHFINSIQ